LLNCWGVLQYGWTFREFITTSLISVCDVIASQFQCQFIGDHTFPCQVTHLQLLLGGQIIWKLLTPEELVYAQSTWTKFLVYLESNLCSWICLLEKRSELMFTCGITSLPL
jgi:hypothetical protein